MTENEAKTLLAQVKENTLILNEVSTGLEMLEKNIYITKDELEQYRAIGTIDEFKALKEKNVAKKVITPPCNTCDKELCDCECEHFLKTHRDNFRCPTCDSEKIYVSEYDTRYDCCPHCGQKLDWEGKE